MSRSENILSDFHREMIQFNEFATSTKVIEKAFPGQTIPMYVNEFWTAKQRAAHSLHEISYRACFKPQLPRFFIERFTKPGGKVYDPFMGRGTTLIESALLGRKPVGCDVNPLAALLCLPRLNVPDAISVRQRLEEIPMNTAAEIREDLLAFYHPQTLSELCALRSYFLERQASGTLDNVDAWIRMTATNRLTGHSAGFFSVYSLPPNQSVSIASQLRINQNRQQVPPQRDISAIILKKTSALFKDLTTQQRKHLQSAGSAAQCITSNCTETPDIADDSIALVVTSPPFLDIVQYDQDNWLRCWFNGIDANAVPIWQLRSAEKWQAAMSGVFQELHRIVVPQGIVAFEVGEVRKGRILLEDLVIPAANQAGFIPIAVLINDQEFTKTSQCWGVDNASKGTNTNRIVILQKC